MSPKTQLSTEKYASIFAYFPDSVLVFREDQILYGNPVALSLFGFSDLERLLKFAPYQCISILQPNLTAGKRQWENWLEEVRKKRTKRETVFCQNLQKKAGLTTWTFSKDASDHSVLVLIIEKEKTNTVKKAPVSTASTPKTDEKQSLEKGYKALAEISPDVVMEFDKNLRHIYCSKNVENYIDKTASDYLGKTHEEMGFPEHMVQLWENTIRWVFKHNESKHLEFKLPNGLYFDWCLAPNYNPESGLVETVFGFARDITHLKDMEKALKRSHTKLETLAKASPDVFFEFDQEARILFVSKNIAQYSGLPASEFIGKTHWELDYPYPKELIELWEGIIFWVFEHGKSKRTEFSLPGGSFWDWYAVPNWDEKNEKVVSVWTFSRDITDRKKAEEELLISKNKFSFALDIAHLAFWEIDMETGLFKVTSRLANLYKLSLEDLPEQMEVEKFINQYVLEEDRKKLIDTFRNTMKGRNKKFSPEEFRMSINGKIHYFLLNSCLIPKPSEEGFYYYGTTQDITSLKEKEAELRQYRNELEILVQKRTKALKKSESKLKDAMDMAKLGTWEFDLDKGEFQVPPNVFKRLKITPEDEKRSTISLKAYIKYIHPLDLPKVKAVSKKISQIHDPEFTQRIEYRIIGTDHIVRTLYSSIKIQMDKTHRHKEKVYGVIQDVTDLRKAQIEKERLFVIAENTPDITLTVDKNKVLIYSNEAAKSFFGTYAPLPTEQLFPQEALQTAIKDGVWTGENLLINQEGYEVPVSQVIMALFHSDGSLESISTIIRDLSIQKKIEQDLRFKKQELDTFVYRASHDLRGPIATLQGLNHVAMVDLKDQQNALHFFKMYTKEVEKLHNILISLIDITRIKDRELQQVPINFGTLLKESLELLSSYPGFSEVEFESKIDLKHTYEGDPQLLRTVFHSILQNTIDFRSTEEQAGVTIHIFESYSGKQLIIEVADNGLGIKSGVKDKVFDMFYRGSEESEGPGLGLYMVKSIIERLKGEVFLKSEEQKGTTITLILPYQ